MEPTDILSSAVTFEFREAAGLAKAASPKGQVASHVRSVLGVDSCLSGWRNGNHSVAIYNHGHPQYTRKA